MKKTIKEDQERLILKSELIDDNSLLEYVASNGKMQVGIRFVEGSSTIQEHIILSMDITKYMKHQESLIEFNEDRTAIAIFAPIEEGYQLKNVYDITKHESRGPAFVDIEYRNRFPNKPLVKSYYKEK